MSSVKKLSKGDYYTRNYKRNIFVGEGMQKLLDFGGIYTIDYPPPKDDESAYKEDIAAIQSDFEAVLKV